MEAERWQRINDLFLSALEREPAGRSAFINEACAGDNELRREVESLLAAHEDSPEFIEEPVVGAAARLMADEHAGSMTGRQIGHYQIISLLGAGGMGEVYLAEDTRLHRRVALKILPQDIGTDRERLLRFEREAFAASALNHPNILTIHEFGAEDKTHFLVSELVQGETVRDRINRASLTLSDSLNITLQIASALQAAHDAGIIHRDIKPENVMIRDDGYVKVLDFGLAKLSGGFPAAAGSGSSEELARSQFQTQAGIIIGTAAYMSPEQARGNEIDARSDIWSLGCVLYEMLTIQQPFGGETLTDTLANIIHSEPASILSLRYDAPAELEHIVMKMLHKSKDQRYQAIKNLHADLKQLERRLEFEGELKRTSSPDRQEAKSPVVNPQTSASTEARNSIAVLPFANLSADPENEYFCDGLAEELLNALAKVNDLKVAARTSAFSFKGKQTNISDIGRALRVNTVLEGSVRRHGNRIRISVQLINASDGFHIWSERYDREMKDIFDVQDEITLSLVEALKLKLLVREKAAALKRYTDNPEAYELYLQGRYHYQKYSPDGLFKAITLFERAIEIEPAYAPAYASLASVLAFAWYFSLLPANETLAKVEAATLRALEIDEGIEEAHVALGRYKFYFEWNWAEAEREFLRAIELNSEDPESRQQYAVILAALGRSDEAIKQASKALELDPLSLLVNLQIGWVYLVLGRSDDTLQLVRKMLEMEPSFHGAYWQMGWALYAKGRMEESLEAYRKAESLGSYPVVTSRVGVVYAELGKRDEAIAVLDRLLEMRKRRPIASLCIAQVYSALGDFDNAFEWLEKSVHERDGELVFLNGTLAPNIRGNVGQAIRKDPRFQGILQRVGLPESEPGLDKTNAKPQSSTVVFNNVEDHGS